MTRKLIAIFVGIHQGYTVGVGGSPLSISLVSSKVLGVKDTAMIHDCDVGFGTKDTTNLFHKVVTILGGCLKM